MQIKTLGHTFRSGCNSAWANLAEVGRNQNEECRCNPCFLSPSPSIFCLTFLPGPFSPPIVLLLILLFCVLLILVLLLILCPVPALGYSLAVIILVFHSYVVLLLFPLSNPYFRQSSQCSSLGSQSPISLVRRLVGPKVSKELPEVCHGDTNARHTSFQQPPRFHNLP